MEGVLVNAKKAGSTITVTVVSDEKGHYSFPANKLEPGEYSLSIRAVGYDLDGSGEAVVTPHQTATADLKLRKTRNLASQLTNAEWIMSVPGKEEQKRYLDCTSCHTVERVLRSQHDADEFVAVMKRMQGYAQGAIPAMPELRVGVTDNVGHIIPPQDIDASRFRPAAEYLSTVNLSAASQWEYPLKTLPRPKGRATRAIITQYDLPRKTAEPHDVILDADGMAWYTDFGWPALSKLDPRTGKVTEYTPPELKKGFPRGMLDLEFDKDGKIWFGMMLQGGVGKFDPKTETFQTFSLPPELNNDVAQVAMLSPGHSYVDGKIWLNNVGMHDILRLDTATGTFESIKPWRDLPDGAHFGSHDAYGQTTDAQNNLYFLDIASQYVGKIDAKTLKTQMWSTTEAHSAPRRGHMDAQGRFWFAEFRDNKIGMFDGKTETMKEWDLPMPYTAPYDMIADKNGDLWTGGMNSDRVVRMDPKTGNTTEYLLPRETNIRRVYVDNTTTPPTFWTGSNHGASIIKLEPLD